VVSVSHRVDGLVLLFPVPQMARESDTLPGPRPSPSTNPKSSSGRRLAKWWSCLRTSPSLNALPPRSNRTWLIPHTEIYLSLIQARPGSGEVKDAVQVENLARYFAQVDSEGKFSDLFAGPASLREAERRRVESEKGWILGP
jgi:hypothetical protein